jgi:hypothetical protein
VRPCDQWFLDALAEDLLIWSFRLALELPNTGSTKNTRLGLEATIAAQNVFCIMRECRRLRSALDLFPSDRSRREFFKKLSPISKAMREFAEAHSGMDMDPLVWQRSNYHPWAWTDLERNQSGSFFPGGLMGNVPFWHPLNIGQNIWNKWLDNRCCYEIPRTENKIIQRLPEQALRYAHRMKFMYIVVEASFQQVSKHDSAKSILKVLLTYHSQVKLHVTSQG